MIDHTRPDFSWTPVSPSRPAFGYAPADAAAPPCVSIVTPFYDAGPVFHETARSVLGQSLQQFEWIVVNDGSRDPEALAALARYRQADVRIRVLDHAVNQGLSAARNTGYRAARSPYVLQLDADDLLEPTAAEKLWWYLETHPGAAFATGYSVHFGAHDAVWTGGFHEGLAFLDSNRVDATCLVRTSAHAEAGGYDEGNREGFEDWDFWLRCASRGRWGATVPEVLDWYRRRSDHHETWPNWNGRAKVDAFRRGLEQRYPSLWTDGFPEPPARAPGRIQMEPPAANRLAVSKPRLLMIVPWLVVGGADRFNLELVRGLTARGWEITIVTTVPAGHAWLPLFARYTPDIFLLDHFLPLDDAPRFLRYLAGSRRHDAVLVSNSELGYLLVPALRAYLPGTALVSVCHGVEEEWKDGGYPRMAAEVDPLLDAQIVAARQVGEWMAGRGAEPARTHVVYIGADTDRWAPDPTARAAVRAELAVDESVPVILTAARLSAEKQPRVLAGTLLELSRQGVPFSALVAGDGPELSWLETFVVDHGLGDRVRLLGAVQPDRLRELYAAADVFFLPSRREGIALACFEAMSAGLAVVAADVGGQRELIVPGTGVLVAPGGDAEVGRYVEALLPLLAAPDARRQMGAAARSRVADGFRLDQMEARVESILRAAVDARRGRPGVAVAPEVAAIVAARAVEYLRLASFADTRWKEAGHQPPTPPAPPPDPQWVVELQTGKRWLEEQYENWRQAAGEREQQILALKHWIDELEAGKQWLEAQNVRLTAELGGTKEQA